MFSFVVFDHEDRAAIRSVIQLASWLSSNQRVIAATPDLYACTSESTCTHGRVIKLQVNSLHCSTTLMYIYYINITPYINASLSKNRIMWTREKTCAALIKGHTLVDDAT